MREIWLRRLRRTHEINCLHSEMEYVMEAGSGVIIRRCSECGYDYETIGWDDMPLKARECLLEQIEKDKYGEEA